ncbi:hypothetical protein ARMSODRAFT_1028151 [Armillaria solidipes]|uniref:Heterokaryon incompatibility domain-containing protein n=1 Tax=Armillaria solidipes TaxID=1076256 RepID=A0A2H3AHW6_9AGAR|nr:hypothetical protein ARMSODRAFT_1028151 [Armillaria solidipes]
MRRTALHGNHIVQPQIYPRRVWDLYSNRVVLTWSTGAEYSDAISHAWVDEKERMNVWTPINGRQWPVSIPKDTDFNLIRIEMLNMGLEYVRLDVPCLRWRGGLREDLRVEEWMHPPLDRSIELSNDRSWLNRARTLQEVAHPNHEFCGVTPGGPLDAKPYKDGSYANDILEEMRRIASTNPMDKIAGIAFLLGPYTITAYYESQSTEGAWTALVNTTNSAIRGALFFLYPEPGNAGTILRPSWDQLMEKPLPEYHTPADNSCYTRIERDAENNVDRCEEALCIENGFVRGLAVVSVPEKDRHGELLIEDSSRTQHSFHIIAIHQYPIPDGTYTLIGSQESRYDSPRQWVQWEAGRRLSDEASRNYQCLKWRMTRKAEC